MGCCSVGSAPTAIASAFALALAVALGLAWPQGASGQTIAVHLGTGDSTVRTLSAPQAVLDRGGMRLDGLPIRRRGGTVAVLPWDTMKHLVFIPGDIPTVVITYRDGSENMLDVEPCRIVSGATSLDIHDVAEIVLR